MGKWAVILGASSGMGLASAKKLAAEGFHLCLVHRDRKSELKRIEEAFLTLKNDGTRLLAFNVDAIKAEVMDSVLSGLAEGMQPGEKVGLLLHSIAKGNLKPMVGVEGPVLGADDFQLTFDAMATSYHLWVKGLFEHDLWGDHALALALSSEGNRRAWKNYGAVSAAKASLEAISRQIAVEWGPHGIRSNIIQAGITDTPSLRLIPGSEVLKASAEQRNPLGRLTTPEDVAGMVYLLTRKEARWVNGAVIPVDGGEHIA